MGQVGSTGTNLKRQKEPSFPLMMPQNSRVYMQPAAMHGLPAELPTAGVATLYEGEVKGQRRYKVWMDEDNEIE